METLAGGQEEWGRGLEEMWASKLTGSIPESHAGRESSRRQITHAAGHGD